MFDLNDVLVPASYSVREAFGLEDVPENVTIDGFAIPEPSSGNPEEMQFAAFLRKAIPQIDHGYQFRKELVRDIFFWWKTGEGDVLLLWGPTGSGKTSVFEQWCARLGIPLFMAKGHRRFEPMEAFGQFVGGENGTTPWVDGPITMAARYGLPCIVNEYDRIAADRSIVFNDVFEGRSFPIPGKSGEVVTPRPGFRVAVTANSNLVEELSGNYGTATQHDTSVLERMIALHVDYPSEETERRVLRKELEAVGDDLLTYWFEQEGIRVSTPSGIKEGGAVSREDFIQGLLDVARKIRQQSKDGGNASDAALERTMSTRILRKWARHSVAQSSVVGLYGLSALHFAMRKCLSSLATESTRIALHQAVENVFGIEETIQE